MSNNTKVCVGVKGQPCVVSDKGQKLENFYKNKRCADGYTNTCKACAKKDRKLRYLQNRESVLESTKAYGKANRDKTRKATKEYYYRNRDKSIQRKLNWYKANPDKANHTAAMYRARAKSATPKWLSDDQKEQIRLVYSHAKECEMLSGDKYHVDHIIPLKGENICGLHVPWNLQVLPADINISKGNKYNGEEAF